jgi:hypothetical protein
VITPDDETWQGSTDIYDPLERDQIDAALVGSGWTALLGDPPRHRFCKQNFKLAFEPQGGGTPW